MRRVKLLLLMILFGTSVFYAQTQQKIPWPSLSDSPWPVLRGDVHGTKRSEYKGPKTPNVIWTKTYQTGIINGPLIGENGNLYFGSRYRDIFDTENYFYCTDSLGNLIWKFATDGFEATDSAPLIDKEGTVYFGSKNGSFYAINTDGSLKWEYKSPTIFSSIKNLVADKQGNIYATSYDSLYCFSPNGDVRFRIYAPNSLTASLAFSPSGEVLYLPALRSWPEDTLKAKISAIDLNGNVIWNKEFDDFDAESVMLDNAGRIYIAAEEVDNPNFGRALICLDESGNIIWLVDEPQIIEHGCSPTIDTEGNITFPIYQGLASVDYDGKLRWQYIFDSANSFQNEFEEIVHSLISDADGTIYAGSGYGNFLYALSNQGELLWSLPLNGQFCNAPPSIGKDGTLYVGTTFGFDGLGNLENNLIAIKDDPNSIEDDETPTEFELSQNYPNPFNPSTTIKFNIPNVVDAYYASTAHTTLKVYDILGREIKTLLNKPMQPGSYEVEFDGSNLTSGVYFYVLETDGKRLSRKMVLLK